MQDAGEFIHKVGVRQFNFFHLSGKAVIGNNRRNRGKQTNGSGDQRFGDPREPPWPG